MENHEILESLWMIDFEKNEFVEYPNKEMIYHLITITSTHNVAPALL